MAKQISTGFTDTSITGAETLQIPLKVNYQADYRTQVEKPDEVQIVNLTTDLGLPEKFRFAISDVKNVYSGTDIDPNLYATSRRGVSLLVQNTETWKVTDTADTAFEAALPVSCHLVIRIPADGMITTEMVQGLVNRTIMGLYPAGSTSLDRLNAMLRGSLEPTGL